MRERAAKLLPRLVELHGPTCVWCRRRVVVRRLLPDDLVIYESSDYVNWYGNATQVLKATVEHLNPLSEGGTNAMENLRPACGPCNRKRSGASPEKFAARLESIWKQLSQKPKMSVESVHINPRYAEPSLHRA